jgi:hypothetical protein
MGNSTYPCAGETTTGVDGKVVRYNPFHRPYGCPENAGRLLKKQVWLCHNQSVAAVLTEIIGVLFFLNEHALEERNMLTLRKQVAALFADRQSQQWIVRDPEGNFWVVPNVESPWDHRQPFQLTEEAALDPVPGHYKDLLGLPF